MKTLRKAGALGRPAVPAMKLLWVLTRRAFVAAYRHNQFGTAKGAAYSALLSFFPLLATAATFLLHFKAQFVSEVMWRFLAQAVPPGTADLVFYYFAIRGKQPLLIPVTGMLLSIWAASGLISTLIDGFEAAYRIPAGRPFLRKRALCIILVFSAAVLVLGASLMVVFGHAVEHWIVRRLGLLPATTADLEGWIAVLGGFLRYLIAMLAIIAGASIMYYFGPNRPQRWKLVWPGAVFATLLWFGATSLFGWYVRNVANYNVMYGSIATVVLLLVWMYLLAAIAYVGCEFNSEFERIVTSEDYSI